MILMIWAILLCLVEGQSQEGSYLIIEQPWTLHNQYPNGIEHTPAMFGIPAYGYGRSISGIVVFPPENNRDGCNPINQSDAILPWPERGTKILLIDRGQCNFVLKIKHAEDAGASGVIVANNRQQSVLPYMGDDGSGGSISIPSMLISIAAGNAIKTEMMNGTVVLTMTWDIPHDDGRVEWEFWTSSVDPDGKDFKHSFKRVVQVLGNSTKFTPRYYLWDGAASGCVQPRLPCAHQCTNGGRYCSIDPENDFGSGLDGAHVVRENLRQICIWKVLETSGEQLKWWDYVEMFEVNCNVNSRISWNKGCSSRMMQRLGINDTAVFQCVDGSGGAEERGGINPLLEKEISDRYNDGAWFLPTITINGVAYRGTLECSDIEFCGVLRTICSGFKAGTEHAACSSSPGCEIGLKRDVCGVCGENGKFDGCGQCLEETNPKFKINGVYDGCGVCLNPSDTNFNKSCADCLGELNGGRVLDECEVCDGPGKDACETCPQKSERIEKGEGGFDACRVCLPFNSPIWNQTCAGCDGIPNSGKKFDSCQVCDGPGKDVCGNCRHIDDPDRVNPGTGGIDTCGTCLHFNSPHWNQSCAGCDGIPYSGKELDVCGICGGTGKNECGRCNGPGKDYCGRCLLSNDTQRVEFGQGGYDACGECLRFNSPEWNTSCAGCDGIPHSNKKVDICGVCDGPGKDECGKCKGPGKDVCGRCLESGDTQRVELGQGGYDVCGECLHFNNPEWNMSCAGCDGIPHSNKKVDSCGVCGGPGKNECGRCNGPGKDVCGRCLLSNDTQRVELEQGGYDACGECLHFNSPGWNISCAGCDGIPHSNKILDSCGVCDGRGRDKCGNCGPDFVENVKNCATQAIKGGSGGYDIGKPKRVSMDSPQPLWVTLTIVISSVVVLIIVGALCLRERDRRVRGDIDRLLKDYLPLDQARASSLGSFESEDGDTTNALV